MMLFGCSFSLCLPKLPCLDLYTYYRLRLRGRQLGSENEREKATASGRNHLSAHTDCTRISSTIREDMGRRREAGGIMYIERGSVVGGGCGYLRQLPP
ncbi:hypothetical protein F5X96DRAFT_646725 [Biscogniauxia mediterranea]|nr:hypothetical protein F5X96DRAFT_646725 [Biscogniauxia mediterranea]